MAAEPSPSPDVDRAIIGTILDGRYRIDAVLGSGGMGRVYRGEHTGIGRTVAIKVLHADLTRNRDAAARFQREAIASGRLDHPNIVAVSDFGMLGDGGCYLVMEMLEGEALSTRLERQKRLPWREALAVLRGVLHGLGHAHERGVVHRDIKPDNVFLAWKDQELLVKILDFGIAKLFAGSADDPASTRAGLTVGTPAYLSPEQAVGGAITPASDLYSATILMFEMLTGRPPFVEADPLAMLGAHVSRDPPRILEVAPEIELPLGLEDVVHRGLMKSAVERIPTAAEYLNLLDGIHGAMGGLGDASVIMTSSMPSPPAPRGSAPSIPSATPRPSPAALGAMPTTPMPASTAPTAPAAPVHAATAVPASRATPFPITPHPAPAPRRPLPTPVPTNDQSIIITVTVDPAGPGPASTGPVSGPAPAPVAPAAALPENVTSTAIIDRQRSMVSLGEAVEAIPRRWIKIGAIVVGAILLIAIVLGIATRGGKGKAAAPGVAPVIVSLPDPETRLKAALHDLTAGKTCEERREAIPRIVSLGPRSGSIEALRKARYRMRGGMLGLGDSNTNSCLKAEAESAIKALGGTVK